MEKDFMQLQEERAEIRERYPNVTFPTPVLEPVWFGRREKKLVPATKAIIDKNTGVVMNLCSDQYKVVHYEDVIRMVEETTSNLTQYGKIQLCPQILSNGGKMKLSMKFPEASDLIRVDNIFPKIDVFTSYDLSYRLMGRFGAFVLRCTNGMGTWKNFRQFARKHLQTLNILDLEHTILEGLEIFGLQVDSWREWDQKVIDLQTYEGIWQMLPFSEKEKEKIEVLPEISSTNLTTIKDAMDRKALTVWGMNSILTQYLTHEVKSDIRRIELEPEIAKVMELTYEKLAA